MKISESAWKRAAAVSAIEDPAARSEQIAEVYQQLDEANAKNSILGGLGLSEAATEEYSLKDKQLADQDRDIKAKDWKITILTGEKLALAAELAETKAELEKCKKKLESYEQIIANNKEEFDKSEGGKLLLEIMTYGRSSEKLNNGRDPVESKNPIEEGAPPPEGNNSGGAVAGEGTSGGENGPNGEHAATSGSGAKERKWRAPGNAENLLKRLMVVIEQDLLDRQEIEQWILSNHVVKVELLSCDPEQWIETKPPVLVAQTGVHVSLKGKCDNGKIVYYDGSTHRSRKGAFYGASTVASWVHGKYALGQPLYLQERELNRKHYHVTRGTMSAAILSTAKLHLNNLNRFMLRLIRQRGYNQADESPILVLRIPVYDSEEEAEDALEAAANTEGAANAEAKSKSKKSKKGKKVPKTKYMWLFMTGELDNDVPIISFNYANTRGMEFIKEHYADHKGGLSCDAYQVYLSLADLSDGELKIFLCWSHLRRRFWYAYTYIRGACANSLTEDEAANTPEMEVLLALQRIFAAEAKYKHDTVEKRRENRKNVVAPLVDEFFQLIKRIKATATGMSYRMKDAISYSLNHEEEFRNFLDDPNAPIDNSLCERTIRGLARVRNNSLFCVGEDGADAMATYLSLIATASANDADPLSYLTYVIGKLSYIKNMPDPDKAENDAWYEKYMPWSETYKAWEKAHLDKENHVDEAERAKLIEQMRRETRANILDMLNHCKEAVEQIADNPSAAAEAAIAQLQLSTDGTSQAPDASSTTTDTATGQMSPSADGASQAPDLPSTTTDATAGQVSPSSDGTTQTQDAPSTTTEAAAGQVSPSSDGIPQTPDVPSTTTNATAGQVSPSSDSIPQTPDAPSTTTEAAADQVSLSAEGTSQAPDTPSTTTDATAGQVCPSADATSQAADRPSSTDTTMGQVRPSANGTSQAADRPSTTTDATAGQVSPSADGTIQAPERPSTTTEATAGQVSPSADGTIQAPERPSTTTEATAGQVSPSADGTTQAADRPSTADTATGQVRPSADGTTQAADRPSSTDTTTGQVRPSADGATQAADRSSSADTATGQVRPSADGATQAADRSSSTDTATGQVRPSADGTTQAADHPSTADTSTGQVRPSAAKCPRRKASPGKKKASQPKSSEQSTGVNLPEKSTDSMLAAICQDVTGVSKGLVCPAAHATKGVPCAMADTMNDLVAGLGPPGIESVAQGPPEPPLRLGSGPGSPGAEEQRSEVPRLQSA